MRILASPAIFLCLSLAAMLGFGSISASPAGQSTGSTVESEEQKRLADELGRLAPQRPGIVDSYLISIALDGDPVFAREARAAADVLGRRYGAESRTIVLAGSDGGPASSLAHGSPSNLERALGRIAELMDRQEDVLILFATTHGAPDGLFYRFVGNRPATLTPQQMRNMFNVAGVENRLLIFNACYSGIFIPVLQAPSSVIVTAASRGRTSFGCVADSDWTFFGDALINHALRKPQTLGAAFTEATSMVAEWEARFKVTPSQPQIYLGSASARWLGPLEQRVPRIASTPTGRPAIETSVASFRTE